MQTKTDNDNDNNNTVDNHTVWPWPLTPNCNYCKSLLTVEHILTSCSAYKKILEKSITPILGSHTVEQKAAAPIKSHQKLIKFNRTQSLHLPTSKHLYSSYPCYIPSIVFIRVIVNWVQLPVKYRTDEVFTAADCCSSFYLRKLLDAWRSIHLSMHLLAKCQHDATQLTMLNGAPNKRGKPSVKTLVLHNNTS